MSAAGTSTPTARRVAVLFLAVALVGSAAYVLLDDWWRPLPGVVITEGDAGVVDDTEHEVHLARVGAGAASPAPVPSEAVSTEASRGSSASLAPAASPAPRVTPHCTPQQCIEATFPSFAQCLKYTLVANLTEGAGCTCDPVVFDDKAMRALLAHWRLVLVGDSTMRRAGHQLVSTIEHTRFTDTGKWMTHSFMEDGQLAFAVEGKSLPKIAELGAYLAGLDPGAPPFPLSPALMPNITRNAYVVAYSSHDLCVNWTGRGGVDASLPFLHLWVDEVVATVAALRATVEPGSPFMFRLPIHQCCAAKYRQGFVNTCNRDTRDDPVNAQITLLTPMLRARFAAVLPDVPLLPMSWTLSPNGFDRHECAPCDEKGTHFGRDLPRLAFLQQVLNAIRWMTRT